MKKMFIILSIVASATIFSCANNKGEDRKDDSNEVKNETIVDEADQIAYSYHPSSVAPNYYRGYTITITNDNLHLAINSYGDTLLRKDWPFTEEKFNSVKRKLKNLKEDGEIDDREIAAGGTAKSIALYKNRKKIFDGIDHGRTKNFSGADIDLSYLVPDLEELIKGTEMKDGN